MSSIVDFCKKKNFVAVTCLFGRSRALIVLPFVCFRFFFFHEKENYEVLLKVSADKVPRC